MIVFFDPFFMFIQIQHVAFESGRSVNNTADQIKRTAVITEIKTAALRSFFFIKRKPDRDKIRTARILCCLPIFEIAAVMLKQCCRTTGNGQFNTLFRNIAPVKKTPPDNGGKYHKQKKFYPTNCCHKSNPIRKIRLFTRLPEQKKSIFIKYFTK